MIVNFDNAATTFPKPPAVRLAAERAMVRYGNAGRGGHPLAVRTSALLYTARETAAAFFGTVPEHVVFTSNCTHALNLAIQGFAAALPHDGGHFIISGLEHNSVLRPVHALAQSGRIRYSIAAVHPTAAETVQSILSQIRPDTKAVICTLASNVTGQMLPWRDIGSLCQKRGICFIADGAQACGILPVSLSDGINILCTAGHKGLYGLTGTGLLLTDGRYPLLPLMQGGSGSQSALPTQPAELPDALECGTLNIIGAASLQAGMHFIRQQGMETMFRTETVLCELLLSHLRRTPHVTIYRDARADYVPIVSFNIDGMPSETAAAALAERGFCLRAGLHCAPLAHRHLGTEQGTLRFSPSIFSKPKDVLRLAEMVRQMAVTAAFPKKDTK